MEATATELKNNLGYYLKLVQTEDIKVMRNGHYVAKLISPKTERIEKVKCLFGIGNSADDLDVQQIRDERRGRYASAD